MRFSPQFLIRRDEAYPYTALVCVTEGRGSVSIDGKTIPVLPNRIYILPPYTVYEYCADFQDPFSIIWAEFCGGDSERLVGYLLSSNGYAFSGEYVSALTDSCRQLIHPPMAEREIWLSSRLYEILLQLYQACCSSSAEQSTRIYQILDYLDVNLSRRLTLEQVASAFGYNPSYFSKYFYQNTGVHFSAYLTEHRVERSKQLLLTTTLSLDQIAHQVGFYDASYLIRKFQQLEHISPFQFRKQHSLATVLPRQAPLPDPGD